MGTIVSYIKGALFLFSNRVEIPTDIMVLLRNTFCSTECDDFTTFMSNVYFNHKRKIHEIECLEYITLADKEYRTLYRKQKWIASKSDPSSGFFVAPKEKEDV